MKHILISFLTVVLMTACSPSNTESRDLDTLILEQKKFYSGLLPRVVDEDTRVDSVDAMKSELRFNCTLVSVSKAELDISVLNSAQHKVLKQEAERVENLNTLLKHGATLVYSYKDKDGAHVTDIRVRKE